MTKKEFLDELKKGLLGLPEEDITRSIEFYSEMIDDRMEEGLLEEEAVSAVGAVDEILSQILAEVPPAKIPKETIKTKRQLRVWEIVRAIGAG